MARRAAGIKVDFQAGTGTFLADVDKAKAKVIEFNSASASSMRENAAVVRAFSGDLKGSNRELAMILTNSLGLGPVLTAAFKVAGPAILAVSVVDLGIKVKKAFDDIRELPEKITGAFRTLSNSLRASNDELSLSNAKIENEIAKLEKKPENKLAEALEEARVEADRLADSLDRDLSALNKALKENEPGWWSKAASWFANVTTGPAAGLTQEIGGAAGFGGFTGKIDKITAEGNAAMDRALAEKNVKAEESARREMNRRLAEEYGKELQAVAERLKPIQKDAKGYFIPVGTMGQQQAVPAGDVEMLRHLQSVLKQQEDHAKLLSQNQELTVRRGQAQDAAEATKKLTETEKALAAAHREVLGIENEGSPYQKWLQERQAKKEEIRTNFPNQRIDFMEFDLDTALEADKIRADQQKKIAEEVAKARERFEVEHYKEIDESITALSREQMEVWIRDYERRDALEKASIAGEHARAQESARHVSRMDDIVGRGGRDASAQQQLLAALRSYNARVTAAREVLNLEMQTAEVIGDEAKKREATDRAALEAARARNELAEKEVEIQQEQFQRFKQALEPLINDISGQLADTLTGKKTNWGKSLESTGRGMLQSGIRGGFDRVLGLARPDGSRSNPMWTRSADIAPSLPGMPGAGTPGNAAGGLGILSLLTSLFPHRAAGGPLSASGMTIVGEDGPEILSGVSGYITSNADAHRMFGGGGVTVPVSVDARGSDIGVYHRAVDAARHLSQAAMSGAMRAQAERSRRVPV